MMYFIHKVINTFITLFLMVTVVFILQRFVPGSPADTMLGPDAPLEQKQQWLHTHGFDLPMEKQFIQYIKGIVRLDFGKTFASNRPIFDVILPRFFSSCFLGICAFLISAVISIFLGTLSALKEGLWQDKLLISLSLMGISAPATLISPLLIWLLAVKIPLFPLWGKQGMISYVLPILTLSIPLIAINTRMFRAYFLETMGEDYIRTAKAKGARTFRRVCFHGLPNALLPMTTLLGLQCGALLGGSVITEYIFAWPGMASLALEAVQTREYNVVSGSVIMMCCSYLFVGTMADVIQRFMDPRLRNT